MKQQKTAAAFMMYLIVSLSFFTAQVFAEETTSEGGEKPIISFEDIPSDMSEKIDAPSFQALLGGNYPPLFMDGKKLILGESQNRISIDTSNLPSSSSVTFLPAAEGKHFGVEIAGNQFRANNLDISGVGTGANARIIVRPIGGISQFELQRNDQQQGGVQTVKGNLAPGSYLHFTKEGELIEFRAYQLRGSNTVVVTNFGGMSRTFSGRNYDLSFLKEGDGQQQSSNPPSSYSTMKLSAREGGIVFFQTQRGKKVAVTPKNPWGTSSDNEIVFDRNSRLMEYYIVMDSDAEYILEEPDRKTGRIGVNWGGHLSKPRKVLIVEPLLITETSNQGISISQQISNIRAALPALQSHALVLVGNEEYTFEGTAAISFQGKDKRRYEFKGLDAGVKATIQEDGIAYKVRSVEGTTGRVEISRDGEVVYGQEDGPLNARIFIPVDFLRNPNAAPPPAHTTATPTQAAVQPSPALPPISTPAPVEEIPVEEITVVQQTEAHAEQVVNFNDVQLTVSQDTNGENQALVQSDTGATVQAGGETNVAKLEIAAGEDESTTGAETNVASEAEHSETSQQTSAAPSAEAANTPPSRAEETVDDMYRLLAPPSLPITPSSGTSPQSNAAGQQLEEAAAFSAGIEYETAQQTYASLRPEREAELRELDSKIDELKNKEDQAQTAIRNLQQQVEDYNVGSSLSELEAGRLRDLSAALTEQEARLTRILEEKNAAETRHDEISTNLKSAEELLTEKKGVSEAAIADLKAIIRNGRSLETTEGRTSWLKEANAVIKEATGMSGVEIAILVGVLLVMVNQLQK